MALEWRLPVLPGCFSGAHTLVAETNTATIAPAKASTKFPNNVLFPDKAFMVRCSAASFKDTGCLIEQQNCTGRDAADGDKAFEPPAADATTLAAQRQAAPQITFVQL